MSVNSKWEEYFSNENKLDNRKYVLNQSGRGLGYNRKIERVYIQKGGSNVNPVMTSSAVEGYNRAESQVKKSRKRKRSSSRKSVKGVKKRKKSHSRKKKSTKRKGIKRKTPRKKVRVNGRPASGKMSQKKRKRGVVKKRSGRVNLF